MAQWRKREASSAIGKWHFLVARERECLGLGDNCASLTATRRRSRACESMECSKPENP